MLDDDLRFEPAPAAVPDVVLDETGYEHNETTELELERSFDAAEEERTVTVINKVASYHRSVSLGAEGERRAAVFGALSTPKVEVLGQTFNPIDDFTPTERAELVADELDEIRDLELEEEGTVTHLGEGTTLSTFTGEAVIEEGLTVDVDLHVSDVVESGDDYVIAGGGHPSMLEEERDPIVTMIEGVEHDA